jgi:hypothetical protein
MEQEKLENQNFCSSVRFFCKHSVRDMKRRKCHFCLALCSVFIVVVFSLVINTLVARGPIIFLKLAESSEGEIDGTIEPTFVNNEQVYLNYSRVEEVFNTTYNLSPRKQYCGVSLFSDNSDPLLRANSVAQDNWESQFDTQTGLPNYAQTRSKVSTSSY